MPPQEEIGYSPPTYKAPEGTHWFHFLHGNVPGHQIDFIYRPELPQGALTRQHFSHLARLVKYIEPRLGSSYAFAIGNLSRDDTQYEPGHGGIALIFGLRVKEALDHAGRQNPPFCHAVACVDRQFDEDSILEASARFHEQISLNAPSQSAGHRWYQSYVAMAQQSSWSVLAEIQAYVRSFYGLPALVPSSLGLRWTAEGVQVPRRVVIVYPDQTPFGALAQQMARIAAVLVESDIRWTAISSGREQDLLGGTSVRFVPEGEATQEPEDVVMMHIRQLPADPADIAKQLFGAYAVRLSQTLSMHLKWRHMGDQHVAIADSGLARPWARPAEDPDKPAEIEPAAESSDGLSRPNVDLEAKKKRRSLLPMVAMVAVLIAVLGLAGVGWMASREVQRDALPKRRIATSSVPEASKVLDTEAPSANVDSIKSAEPVDSDKPLESAAAASTQSSLRNGSIGKTKGGVKTKGAGVIGGKLKQH